MSKIVKLRAGDEIPPGARYLSTEREPDPTQKYTRWKTGLFTDTLYECTPIVTVHYYEVDAMECEGEKD